MLGPARPVVCLLSVQIPTLQALLQGLCTSSVGETGLAVCKLLAWYSSCASVGASPRVGDGGNEVI